ncbi:hypothetical protein D3C86_2064600 [compost metagenome]
MPTRMLPTSPPSLAAVRRTCSLATSRSACRVSMPGSRSCRSLAASASSRTSELVSPACLPADTVSGPVSLALLS